MSGPAAVGWCPGALRPMESGDGLILRVKPSGGRLTLDQAAAIAGLALRHGNGQLDITSRANLQIRGVTAPALDRLAADLRAAGLVDRSAAVEAVRNIVVTPLAGLGPNMPGMWPAVRALERRLADDERLHGLPAKWSFAVDDGRLVLSGVGADVRFVFGRAGPVRLQLDDLAGEALLPASRIPDLVSALGHLACDGGTPARMRELAGRHGNDIFGRLGLIQAPRPDDRRTALTPADVLGDRGPFVGFAPAFGGLAAADLLAACQVLRAAQGRELRLTPWKTLLVPGVAHPSAVLHGLRDLGFVCDPGDPRLAVSACVGAPACHRATTPTRAHAEILAGRVAGSVQVAGCAKGCGQTDAARWTLVGRDGRYDVVAQGTARDAPVARSLSFPDAAAWISRAGDARTA